MRTITLAIAGLLLFSGCSSEPKPIEPTSEPTATPTAPTMPSEAREDSPSGAATFVAYWVETFNFGAQTGQVDEMRRLAPRCKPCIGYADDFERLKPSDRAKKPPWRLSNVAIGDSREPIEVAATVTSLNEDSPVDLVFVLNSGAPFQVVDIHERRAE